MILAALYLRADQAKNALEVVETLAKNEPSNLAVLNMLGVARVAAGDRAGGPQSLRAGAGAESRLSGGDSESQLARRGRRASSMRRVSDCWAC